MKKKKQMKNENIVAKMEPSVKILAVEHHDVNVSLLASLSAKENKSVDVALDKINVEDGIMEVPLELDNEELIVGGNNEEEEEEGEEEEENEDDFKSNIPVQARYMLCNIDRDEFVIFQKFI